MHRLATHLGLLLCWTLVGCAARPGGNPTTPQTPPATMAAAQTSQAASEPTSAPREPAGVTPQEAAPPDEHLADRALTIVVLGTSTAMGKNLDEPKYGGAPGNRPWPQLLQEALQRRFPGSRVINLARPKTTTYHALATGSSPPVGRPAPDPARNITAALAHSPDAIILAYQLAGDAPLGEILDNLSALQASAAKAGVRVWISTPIPRLSSRPTDERRNIALLRAQILAKFGAQALDFNAALAQSDGNIDPRYLLGDQHHPNQLGHQRLLEVVLRAELAEASALAPKQTP